MSGFCKNCGAELTGFGDVCSSCEKSSTSTMSNNPSKMWYLAPILFAFIGGIIGYYIIRGRDKKMAGNLVNVGIIMTVVNIFMRALSL